MTVPDLTEYDAGDQIRVVTEHDEEFELQVVDYTHDPIQYPKDRSYTQMALEGEDVWEQVKDRLDSEVLNMDQSSRMGSEELEPPLLYGTIWVGEPEEASEPEYEALGEVESIERIEEEE